MKKQEVKGNPVKGFLALLSFLTIIPTRVHDLLLGARYFYMVPLVGLVEGFIVVLPLYTGLPLELKALLALILSYLVTGFNHIDGFADFIDAIASRKHGEEALRIIKEPWKGPMAIISTILLVLTAFTSIMYLSTRYYYLVVTSHVLASESMFLLAVFSRQPGYQGLGSLFIGEAKKNTSIIYNIVVAALVLALLTYMYRPFPLVMIAFLLMTLTAMVTVFYTYVKAHSILGYSNGDVLGFCFELTKTATLLVAVVPLSTISF